jgi:hypothetical protein
MDNSAGYPLEVIEQIFQDIQSLTPRPQFVVATGDYMNADPQGAEGLVQADLYFRASKLFTGPVFVTMGNHECDTYTEGNCGDVDTNNFAAYRSLLLKPLGQSLPYYVVPFQAQDSSWSAKMIVVACNAWNATQRNWVKQQLQQPTTYTFVAQHEPMQTVTGVFGGPPCLADMTFLLDDYPYDLLIVGHEHTFDVAGKQVTVGTGGADLSYSGPYGFATIEQLPKDAWRVIQYDYSTVLPVKSATIRPCPPGGCTE